eukprot:CAMPEP_0183481216 /NCGR_PEP_ID=MMETSP0370-20130417/174541_1 /TAXON_ID=268820 /ORGANISM="Peridinium aciculiferum, Strain PAER-2" /LENGTH=69 /DNA_ID=CAMNT_0025674333 /DNA_START=1 /DNA_END=207 /DNA_ORIENTATION=+
MPSERDDTGRRRSLWSSAKVDSDCDPSPMSELASVEVEYEGEASGVRQNVSCFFDGVSVHDWSPTKELP